MNQAPNQPHSPPPPEPGEKLGRGMMYMGWLLGLAVLTTAFGFWEKHQENPNRQPNTYIGENGSREVVLQQNRYKHYVSNGYISSDTVQKEAVTFLLDTGATAVVLSEELANKMRLHRGPEGIAETANGLITVTHTRLASLQIGNIILYDVRASINPAMSGKELLLGMTALRHLELIQKGDTLTLRQTDF